MMGGDGEEYIPTRHTALSKSTIASEGFFVSVLCRHVYMLAISISRLKSRGPCAWEWAIEEFRGSWLEVWIA